LVFVVLGAVLAVAEDEGRGRIFYHGRGRNRRQARIVEGRLERGEVDEGLERAAGLALGLGGAVVLARPVGAAAHQREHRPRARLERDERALYRLLAALAADHLLHPVEARA